MRSVSRPSFFGVKTCRGIQTARINCSWPIRQYHGTHTQRSKNKNVPSHCSIYNQYCGLHLFLDLIRHVVIFISIRLHHYYSIRFHLRSLTSLFKTLPALRYYYLQIYRHMQTYSIFYCERKEAIYASTYQAFPSYILPTPHHSSHSHSLIKTPRTSAGGMPRELQRVLPPFLPPYLIYTSNQNPLA